MIKKIQHTTLKKIKIYPEKFSIDFERYSRELIHKGIQCFEVNLDNSPFLERYIKAAKVLGEDKNSYLNELVKNTVTGLSQTLINIELIDFVFISIDSKEDSSTRLTGLIGFRKITDSNEQLKQTLDTCFYTLSRNWHYNILELKVPKDIFKTLTKMASHWDRLIGDGPKGTFSSFSEITVDMHGDLFLELKGSDGGRHLESKEWKELIVTNLSPIEPGWCVHAPALKGEKSWVGGLNFNQLSEASKCLFYLNLYLQVNKIIICDKYLYVKNKSAKQTYQKLGSYKYLINPSVLIKSLVKHFPNTLTDYTLIGVLKDSQLLEDVLLKYTPLLKTNEHICYNTIEFKNGIYLISEDTFLGPEHKNETKCSKYFDINFEEIKDSVPTAWLEYLQNRVKNVNEKCVYFGQIINKKGLKNVQFNEIIKKDKTLLLTAELINLQESTTPTKAKLQVESLCKKMGISEKKIFEIKKEGAKILVYCNKRYKLLLSKNKVKGI